MNHAAHSQLGFEFCNKSECAGQGVKGLVCTVVAVYTVFYRKVTSLNLTHIFVGQNVAVTKPGEPSLLTAGN